MTKKRCEGESSRQNLLYVSNTNSDELISLHTDVKS